MSSSFLLFLSFLPSLLAQPISREEEEEEFSGLLAALVVCVPGLVPVAVNQWSVHFLHLAVRLWVWQRKVHQVGHVSGPLPLPEHLYTAAPQGGSRWKNLYSINIFFLKKKPNSFQNKIICFLQNNSLEYFCFSFYISVYHYKNFSNIFPGLVLLKGDWDCCLFCPSAETRSCGGDWGSWASAVR